MKIILALTFLGLAVQVRAQTNLISSNQVPSLSPEQIRSNQWDAVQKAMPDYFTIEKDPVTDVKTVSLNQYDTIYCNDANDYSKVDVDIIAKIKPNQTLPDTIGIRIISHTDGWKYLDDHAFIIRFDDHKLSPEEFYSNRVLDDATVYEQVWPDFTLQQFHDIAWADNVVFKLGYKNFVIMERYRTKWKLLWKYFDLQKSDQKPDLEKVIGDK